MFGLFKPNSPLVTLEKTWTERRMCWLAQRLGVNRLLEAKVILPTPNFFPQRYDHDVEGARAILDNVCTYMNVEPERVGLEILEDVQMPDAAGHYDSSEGPVIRIARSQLRDTMRLVATLAHELAHEILLGGGLLHGDEPDHEQLTDLLPAFLGMGVFAANSSLLEKYDSTPDKGFWMIGRHGYLPARIHGYACALFCYLRGESNPPWVSHLRRDAATLLRDGLHYLQKTGDSLCRLEQLQTGDGCLSVDQLLRQLHDSSATQRLSALFDLRECGVSTEEVLAALTKALQDRDEYVAGMAARTLADLAIAEAAAIRLLLRRASYGVIWTRAGAIRALGALRKEPEEVVAVLSEMLTDSHLSIRYEAAAALEAFGPDAEAASTRPLFDALNTAIVECDNTMTDRLAHTIRAIVLDVKEAVKRYYRDRDRDLRRQAWDALKDYRPLPAVQEGPFDELPRTRPLSGPDRHGPPLIG